MDSQNQFKSVVCELPACSSRRAMEEATIFVQPLGGGPRRQLVHFSDARKIFAFAWSRDGKRLAISVGPATSDIVLLKGLKK
jgi:hypothetical protein